MLYFRETRIAYTGRAVLERTLQTRVQARHTHRGVQGEVFSRKAQLINCWLVSWEVDGGGQDLWPSKQTLSVPSKISPPLPDNIIQSKYPFSYFAPITFGSKKKTSFWILPWIQRVTNTFHRYVHNGQGYLPFNMLHQSHLITNLNSRNQSAQVRNPKLP